MEKSNNIENTMLQTHLRMQSLSEAFRTHSRKYQKENCKIQIRQASGALWM